MSEHPALLGYDVTDEPEFRIGGTSEQDQAKAAAFVATLTRMRDAIHRWDTNQNRLVYTSFNLVPPVDHRDWRIFLPAYDAFNIDRYPICRQFPYFPHGKGTVGDWGALRAAWQIAHGVAAIENTRHKNPSFTAQGQGKGYNEGGYHWRDPVYEETRYMAYSSMTAGAWGIYHWIRNVSPPNIRENVSRLYRELGQLMPAILGSWETPPFEVSHNHENITRDWLTDRLSDITTLALEDEKNYYLIAADNTGVFEDVTFSLKLPHMEGTQNRNAEVLNEGWHRGLNFDAKKKVWTIAPHTMCFGDVNIYVLPKSAP